jgi:hypothetical protein
MRSTIGPVCSVSYPSLGITSLQSLPEVLTGPEAEGKRPGMREREESWGVAVRDTTIWRGGVTET